METVYIAYHSICGTSEPAGFRGNEIPEKPDEDETHVVAMPFEPLAKQMRFRVVEFWWHWDQRPTSIWDGPPEPHECDMGHSEMKFLAREEGVRQLVRSNRLSLGRWEKVEDSTRGSHGWSVMVESGKPVVAGCGALWLSRNGIGHVGRHVYYAVRLLKPTPDEIERFGTT